MALSMGLEMGSMIVVEEGKLNPAAPKVVKVDIPERYPTTTRGVLGEPVSDRETKLNLHSAGNGLRDLGEQSVIHMGLPVSGDNLAKNEY